MEGHATIEVLLKIEYFRYLLVTRLRQVVTDSSENGLYVIARSEATRQSVHCLSEARTRREFEIVGQNRIQLK